MIVALLPSGAAGRLTTRLLPDINALHVRLCLAVTPHAHSLCQGKDNIPARGARTCSASVGHLAGRHFRGGIASFQNAD